MTLLRLAPPTRLAGLGALALCCALLAGCTPAPEPTPKPTPAFASEEEAFAAAEETYRAYNDASNNNSDAGKYLTGAALQSDISSKRYLKEQGLHLEGNSAITRFAGSSADIDQSVATVTAVVCLDVSDSRVLDVNGQDVTPADRADTWTLSIEFVGSEEGLLISDSNPTADQKC